MMNYTATTLIGLVFMLTACEPTSSTRSANKSAEPIRVRVGPSGGPAIRCGDSPVGIDIFSGDIVVMP